MKNRSKQWRRSDTVLVVAAIVAVVLAVGVVKYTFFPAFPSIASMTRENEIERVSFRAIRSIGRTGDEGLRKERAGYVIEIAERLTAGWPGFEITEFHPTTSSDVQRNILAQIYAHAARTAAVSDEGGRAALLELLRDIRPPPSTRWGLTAWRRELYSYGLAEEYVKRYGEFDP